MKIIIVGAGEVGTHVARQLIEEGKDVIVIEKDPDRAKKVDNALDCLVINGVGTSVDVLKEAGAEDADVFIATTTSDETNLVSCFIVASEFGIPIKIARVCNIEYTRSRSFTSKIAGVDYLINTEQEAAWELYQTLEQGANSTVITFNNPDIQLRELYVERGSILDGAILLSLRQKLQEEFVVAGVVRADKLLIPHGDFVFKEGDTLYVASLVGTFYKLYKKIGDQTHKLRKFAIVGGTPIGIAVAEMLVSKGRSVVIIDKDYSRCKELADKLPNVLVLNGDISESEIYDDEQLNLVDAIVATTKNEELNILSSIHAKKLGVKRAVAVVEKTNYLTIAADIGVDSTVSKKMCAINSIVKTIRRGRVRSVHFVFDGQAEALEVTLQEESKLINVPIMHLGLPKNFLIISVMRDKKSFIPNGQTVLHANDNVILFLLRDNISEFEEYLE